MKRKIIYALLCLGIVMILIFIIIQASAFLHPGRMSISKNTPADTQVKQIVEEKISNPPTISAKNPIIERVLTASEHFLANNKSADGGIQVSSSGMEWKNADGWTITNSNQPVVSAFYLCRADNIENPLKDVQSEVYKNLNTIFISQGFTKNKINSTKNTFEADADNYSLMGYSYDAAYEKGNVACVVNATPVCRGLPGGYGEKMAGSINVACTDMFQENEKVQVPLLKALGLKDDVLYEYQKFGDYIFARVRYYELIAKRQKDDSCMVLYKGQEPPPCATAKKYDFPQELRTVVGVDCSRY